MLKQAVVRKTFYLDTGLLDPLMGRDHVRPDKLIEAFRERTALAAISEVQLAESFAAGSEQFVKDRLHYFVSLSHRGVLRWQASHRLLVVRELCHFDKTFYAPEAVRSSIHSIGHLNANTEASACGRNVLDVSIEKFISHVFSRDGDGLRKRIDDWNALLDTFVGKLERERREFEKSSDLLPFPAWVAATIDTEACDVQLLARRMEALDEQTLQANFPSLWLRRALEIQMINKKTSFEEGDIRDVMHGVYLPYVDVLTADRRFAARISELSIPKGWKNRVVSNASILKGRFELN